MAGQFPSSEFAQCVLMGTVLYDFTANEHSVYVRGGRIEFNPFGYFKVYTDEAIAYEDFHAVTGLINSQDAVGASDIFSVIWVNEQEFTVFPALNTQQEFSITISRLIGGQRQVMVVQEF